MEGVGVNESKSVWKEENVKVLGRTGLSQLPLCYLHKRNIMNVSFTRSCAMWWVVTEMQKHELSRKCVICILFYLKLHITQTANCTFELFTLCVKKEIIQ